MKQCKNHTTCGSPAEAERYEFCYPCWWAQDPRNPVNTAKFLQDSVIALENEMDRIYSEFITANPEVDPSDVELWIPIDRYTKAQAWAKQDGEIKKWVTNCAPWGFHVEKYWGNQIQAHKLGTLAERRIALTEMARHIFPRSQ